MSMRQLIEADCGGANPLVQLGNQFTRDLARNDEGFARAQQQPERQLVADYLGQVAAPPQTFEMNALLQQMQAIEQAAATQKTQSQQHLHEHVGNDWSNELALQQQQTAPALPPMLQMRHAATAQELFPLDAQQMQMPGNYMLHPRFRNPMQLSMPPAILMPQDNTTSAALTNSFFEQAEAFAEKTQEMQADATQDWLQDFEAQNEQDELATENYNQKFWQRLQDEWQKLSEESEHPWLSEYGENYDPYKEYQFAEENPMSTVDNAFEKGKQYLANGNIPSAVLCFEGAAQKEPENAEVWEYLGITQAENEMDPQAIAALKRSLDIKSDNRRVLMALAICYTNESLQSHALKMLTNWMQINPKYQQLMQQHPELTADNAATSLASSMIRGNRLQDVQNLYLEAVRLHPTEIDAEVQEALGVLYNLSSEYDKAVDCFRAALQVQPQNAKIWNRLGASLANGSRSVEAVEAYQQALQLEPGFIRVRYNVGICCMNLKAYHQAAEHFLTALNMQANASANREQQQVAVAGQQQMSETIWNTLKMILSLMSRNDLQKYASERNLTALNEAFKD